MKEKLLDAALKVMQNAYVPYSHFPVGAALLGHNQHIYTGCNVENAAYGSTICAERTALTKAISEGCHSFSHLLIISQSTSFIYPCGACLQMLAEFSNDLIIICMNAQLEAKEVSISDLLPYQFNVQHIQNQSSINI